MSKRKVTLILGPGGIPGAAYEIGGLMALEEITDSHFLSAINEFQGSSCGAVISYALMAGIPPKSLYLGLYPDHPLHFSFFDLNRLNFSEMLISITHAPIYIQRMLRRILAERHTGIYDKLAVPIQEMRLSGVFVTDGIEGFVEKISDRLGLPKRYGEFCKKYRRNLYLLTTDIGSGNPIILDQVNFSSLPIKKAIAASCSVTPLFKPVHIMNSAGREFKLADGAFAMSLGIRHAYERGARLILYFNPLKPTNVPGNVRNIFDISEQLYRIPAHTRKLVAEKAHKELHPNTLIGFEPDTDTMFHNLFRFDLGFDYADHGYITTLRKIHAEYGYARKLFTREGIPLVGRKKIERLIYTFVPKETLAEMAGKPPTDESNYLGLLMKPLGSLKSILMNLISP